jgi:NAD(P)-dependent dehydrogenase (short-subunit alcohol dehydrogenase family)
MGSLKDKSTIITGASGGIGAATARKFAAEGASVLLVDLDEDALRKAVSSIESDRVSYFVANVADAGQTQAYVAAAVERYGGVDVMFANAGIEGKIAPLEQMSEEDFDRVISVNVKGVWLSMKYVVPELMKRGGGTIIVNSSVAGLIGYPNLSAYVASKHAALGLTRAAAIELASSNIRVNAIHPGPIANRMMDSLEKQLAPDAPETVRQGMESAVPLHRYGTNEEIANLAAFLACDDSSYCTGASFVADGGFVAR